jgi:NAD(P)-dependent dehydrogenase (short-subunit alcohol dehydrogenase family)
VARRELAGRSIVVTGGAGGIGAALGRRFVSSGGRVALLDIDKERVGTAAAEIGPAAAGFECDVTDEEACRRALADVAAYQGPVDVLVNNAGLAQRSAFAETDLAVIHRIMDINFWGAVHCTKAALPTLITRRGAVAVVSSVAGFAPLLGRTGYAASKHALHGLFGTLRAELRPAGVDVTIVAPSFVDTPLRRHTLGGNGTVTTHPQSRVGRMMTPDQAAAHIASAIERRRGFVVVGAVGKTTRVLTAVAPALYERIMARSLRSELRPGAG